MRSCHLVYKLPTDVCMRYLGVMRTLIEIMMAWLTREDVLMRLDGSDGDFDGYLDEMHWRL